jgi:hypothetical protein
MEVSMPHDRRRLGHTTDQGAPAKNTGDRVSLVDFPCSLMLLTTCFVSAALSRQPEIVP